MMTRNIESSSSCFLDFRMNVRTTRTKNPTNERMRKEEKKCDSNNNNKNGKSNHIMCLTHTHNNNLTMIEKVREEEREHARVREREMLKLFEVDELLLQFNRATRLCAMSIFPRHFRFSILTCQ